MANNIDCEACANLREDAPHFVANGMTNTERTSLKNDTGLNPSNGNNDCTDLKNMNDCLLGNAQKDVSRYEVCDWKTFMQKYTPNVWSVLDGTIAAICGLWTNIHNLWKKVNQHDCEIQYLYTGTSFKIKETEQSDSAYIVAGKGVSFYLADGTQEKTSDISFRYIAGGLAILSGSCHFYSSENFNEPPGKVCPNFDNDTSASNDGYRTSNARKPNSEWGRPKRYAAGGELVYEIRLKKSEYPQIKSIIAGRGTEANTGAFSAHFQVFNEGTMAYGQHGWCHGIDAENATPGSPMADGLSWGHPVPKGWTYIQCRLHYSDVFAEKQGVEYSPYGWLGMRTERDEISC